MGVEFYSPNLEVHVSSFGWTENGECERIYFLLANSEGKFLRQAYRPNLKKSWTSKLAKATLFDTIDRAKEFALKHFNNIVIDV